MKLEMCESLIYSWLRHVKDCRIVQTNWKPSTTWELQNSDDLETLLESIDKFFRKEFSGDNVENIPAIFKKNSGLNQLIKQCECDLIGWSIRDDKNYFYAVEVAFHLLGLNYGDKNKTTAKVLEKMARAAFCLKGFFNKNDGEIIFASPKIYPNVEEILVPAVDALQRIFNEFDFNFRFTLLYNKFFEEQILNPVVKLCDSVEINDTAELFVRSYQLYSMFYDDNASSRKISPTNYNKKTVGKLVNEDLRTLLEMGAVTEKEVQDMQEAIYSKKIFHCNYPLLSKVRDDSNSSRYYKEPVWIRGEKFFICNDWYEKPFNNDRPYVIKWLKEHGWQTSD